MSLQTLHAQAAAPESKPLLARFPAAGFSIAIFGAILFAILAFNLVSNGPLIQFDAPLSIWLHQVAVKSPAWFVEAMRIVGILGNQLVFGASVLLSISWLILGDFRKALMMAVGVGGGGLLFQILVHLFNRPRPVFPDPLETIHLGSFPSGHTVGTVLFYSLLAYLYLPRISSRALKALVVLAIVLFVLLLGFSRVFLGSHYLTDVLGSIALAMAWGGLVYTSLELFFQGQKRRSLKS